MRREKIALTSATSFTALWIAQALHEAGWDVHALCQSEPDRYTGLRGRRVELLGSWATLHYGVGIEDGGLERWIRAEHPSVFIHHHHFMENFRSPGYDLARARKFGLEPLPSLVQALEQSGCRGAIYSGSYFEPGEGGGALDDPAATPYSRSKREVWLALQKECVNAALPLSKVVIPNPIGPLENEDRLIPKLIAASRSGAPFSVSTPGAVGDQLPIQALAERYVYAATELLEGRTKILRPSGWVINVLDFIQAINSELVRKRLGQAPAVLDLSNSPPPITRPYRNAEPCEPPLDWSAVWDHYARWLAPIYSSSSMK